MIQFEAVDAKRRVCSSGELEHYTAQGWSVIAAFQDDEVQSFYETEPAPAGYQRSGYHNTYMPNGQPVPHGMMSVTRHKLVKVTKFLLSMSAESAIAKMTNELDAEKKAAVVLRDSSAAFEAKLKAEEKKVAEGEARLIHENERNTGLAAEMRKSREQLRTYEVDIGKLRKAIGDLKFSEIVGEKKP